MGENSEVYKNSLEERRVKRQFVWYELISLLNFASSPGCGSADRFLDSSKECGWGGCRSLVNCIFLV